LGYWVDARQVGIYNAAFQTSAIIALVLGAFDTAIAPIAGGLISRVEHAPLQGLYQVTARWSLALTAPLFILMAVWGRDILSLFGPTFALGASCLVLLAMAQLVNASTGATGSLILMSGRPRLIMMNSIVMGVLLIGLNLALVPRFGILGAAGAASCCQLTVSLIRVAQVWRVQHILPFSWEMMKPAAATFIATAAGWMLKGTVGGGPAAQVALALCVLGIYGIALVMFGLDPDDAATASRLWKWLTMRRP